MEMEGSVMQDYTHDQDAHFFHFCGGAFPVLKSEISRSVLFSFNILEVYL